jgi:hypothetical protein
MCVETGDDRTGKKERERGREGGRERDQNSKEGETE